MTVDSVKDGTNWYQYVNADPVNKIDPLGLAYKIGGGNAACGDESNAEYKNKVPKAPPGVDINENIKKAENMSILEWKDKVSTDGEWDYKQDGSQYEDFGNFNYGATGRAVGFSDETLLRAAGVVQKLSGTSRKEWGEPWGDPPYGDGPNDQAMIRRGIKYYNNSSKKNIPSLSPSL